MNAFLRVLGLLFLVAFAPSACESTKECTLIGCVSGATGTVDVSLAPAELDGTRMEVCRNGSCAFASVGVTAGEMVCAGTLVGDSSRAECDSRLEATPNGVRVRVSYRPGPNESLADGDAFTIRITDESGSRTIAERAGTVAHYTESYPNGKDCDVHPCLNGTF